MADTDSKWMLRLTDILGVEASSPVLTGASFSRSRCEPADGIEVLRDSFLGLAATCHFIRCSGLPESGLSLRVDGEYQFESVAAGGWLLRPRESGGDHYWLPSPPKLRTLDTDGHILSVSDAEVLGLDMSSSGIEAVFRLQEGYVLDLVFWRINGEQSDFTCFLSTPNAVRWPMPRCSGG